jgi:phage/plasmid-like protein (TIGR03299 family)
MPHELDTTKAGKVRMAYADHEVPWHRLGTPMSGLQTAEDMLRAAEADYTVVLTGVAAVDVDGQVIMTTNEAGLSVPLMVEDSRATVRINNDGTYDSLSTVGTRYVVQQNADCLLKALDIVGATRGDAVVDTCGVLHGGREFFASIDMGGLIIDPTGVNDKIERYLLVRNGHDGKTPITYANTSIRAVCKNTVNAGMKSALRVFTARHTRNQDSAINEAQNVLELSTAWADEFTRTAEKLLSINILPGSYAIDKVLNSVFPKKKDESDRQRNNREEINGLIRSLYLSDKNAGGYGNNGWSLYNTVVEYFDHYRDATPSERAMSSMDHNSWVTKKKHDTQDAILALI